MPTDLISLLRRLRPFAGLALLGIFAACRTTPPPAVTWSLPNTVWKLVELNHEAVAAGHLPALVFETEGMRVHGRAGVNSFTGTYTLAGSVLGFGPLAVTKMAGEPRQMEVERDFLAALGRVTSWRIDGNLLIFSAGKDEFARFQALPAGSPL
ncbi:MAG: META domain-containing protein [Lacunisphaera sp.]